MTRIESPLALALLSSLLLHLLPFLPGVRPAPDKPTPPPLQARLTTPVVASPVVVPLALTEPETPPGQPPAKPRPTKPTPPSPTATTAPNWQREIRRQFAEQQRRGDFYPAEAIARGLQGDVEVLLLLAPDGSVMAARIEQSSGQRLLDDAALRAVRALHALPANTPRESLQMVSFRLR
jgi:protein TonB